MALLLRIFAKHIYLLCLLEYIDITQVIDKTVEDSLLYHFLQHEKEVPASKEIFETYFINFSYLRKEAAYGKKCTKEEEVKLPKNNIGERLYFIYNIAKIQQKEEDFFRICGKVITR